MCPRATTAHPTNPMVSSRLYCRKFWRKDDEQYETMNIASNPLSLLWSPLRCSILKGVAVNFNVIVSFNSNLLLWISGSLSMVRGCLGALSSDLHGQNKFRYNTKTLLTFFCCAEICIDGAETIMDKTAGLLAWIKAVSPNCTTSIIVFFTTPYCGKKNHASST